MNLVTPFAALLSAVALTACVQQPDDCASIVRYDESRGRIFVVCPSVTEMSPEMLNQLVGDIFQGFSGPPDEYFISFFSDVELAGNEDDEEIRDNVLSGEWANAFLAEYYTHSHEVTLWPRIADRRLVVPLPPQ